MKIKILFIIISTSIISLIPSCFFNEDAIIVDVPKEDKREIDSLFNLREEVSFDTTQIIEKLCLEFESFSDEIEILSAYKQVTQKFDEKKGTLGKPMLDSNSMIVNVVLSKKNQKSQYWRVYYSINDDRVNYKMKANW